MNVGPSMFFWGGGALSSKFGDKSKKRLAPKAHSHCIKITINSNCGGIKLKIGDKSKK